MNLDADDGAHGNPTMVLEVLAGMVIIAERTLRKPKPPRQTYVSLASINQNRALADVTHRSLPSSPPTASGGSPLFLRSASG